MLLVLLLLSAFFPPASSLRAGGCLFKVLGHLAPPGHGFQEVLVRKCHYNRARQQFRGTLAPYFSHCNQENSFVVHPATCATAKPVFVMHCIKQNESAAVLLMTMQHAD